AAAADPAARGGAFTTPPFPPPGLRGGGGRRSGPHHSETAAWLDDLRPADDTPADIAAAISGAPPRSAGRVDASAWLRQELAHV
ncbi:hypothetical protein, partial [Streptomyces sp. NPDC101224]|uniref:hypothetical protein n=1 Tax=Streptomyces sp. NPDC101224 TaxID=3366134 RepID=UPI003805F350